MSQNQNTVACSHCLQLQSELHVIQLKVQLFQLLQLRVLHDPHCYCCAPSQKVI